MDSVLFDQFITFVPMVFESISKGLSNLGTSTLNTGKSVMNSTSKAAKGFTDPLTGVAKKTMRHLPFVGSNDDVRDMVHDHFSLELFQSEVKSEMSKTLSTLRKAKFPTTKLKEIKSSLDLILHSLDHESSLEHWSWQVQQMLKTYKNALKTSVANEYVDGKWKSKNKIKLTVAQLTLAQGEVAALWKTVKWTTKSLKDLIAYVTIKPTSTYQSNKKIKEWRAKNHESIDDLITAKFDIVTHQKKLYYLMLELERKVTKAKTHKNTLSQTQINDLIKVKIPALQKTINELRKNIGELESKISTNRSAFDAGAEQRLKEVQTWLSINEKETAKQTTKEKKEQKSHSKALATLRKTYNASSKAIETKIKSPYSDAKWAQSLISTELKAYSALSEATIERLSDDFALFLWWAKDIKLKNMLVQEHINREYDAMLLNKEQALHLKLLNRINKKQVSAHIKLHTQIKKLKNNKSLALSSVAKRAEAEKKITLTAQKNAEKWSNTLKETVATQQEQIKQRRKLHLYLAHQWAQRWAQSEAQVKNSMISYLEKDKLQIQTSLVAQKKIITEIQHEIKKSEIQLKENERSAEALQDKARTKKALDHEKVYHEQELTLDTLEHHVDTEQDLLAIVSDRISTYKSESKKLTKKSEKESKLMKKYAKELKKNALAKKMIS